MVFFLACAHLAFRHVPRRNQKQAATDLDNLVIVEQDARFAFGREVDCVTRRRRPDTFRGQRTPFRWRAALFVGALCTAASMTTPGVVYAEGFLDFLFGGSQSAEPDGKIMTVPPSPIPGLGRDCIGSAGTGERELRQRQYWPPSRLLRGYVTVSTFRWSTMSMAHPEKHAVRHALTARPRSFSEVKSAPPSLKTASITPISTQRSHTASNW